MTYQIENLSQQFNSAKPFPHLVIDNFLPEQEAEAALAAFPLPDDPLWTQHGRVFDSPGNALKYEMAQYDAMHRPLQRVVDRVNSAENIAFVEAPTGIHGLIPDPSLYGGGINLVPRGGFLRTHSDFNYNNELKAYRTINFLVYLNKDWLSKYNGGLELYHPETMKCEKVLDPIFNRAALFVTTSHTPHGYNTIQCPENMSRKSFNFYFYKTDPIEGIAETPHRTLWS